jgi:hypothetical protein
MPFWLLLSMIWLSSHVGAAALSLDVDENTVVGNAKTALVLTGVKPEQSKQLKWSIPEQQRSPLTWIGEKTAVVYAQATAEQIKRGQLKVSVKLGDDSANISIELLPALEILSSAAKVDLKDSKPLVLGIRWPKGLPQRAVLMRSSLGKLRELVPGKRWVWSLKTPLPASWRVVFSCHDALNPNKTLGVREIPLLNRAMISGLSEEGSELTIQMGDLTLGPYLDMGGIPELDLEPGLEKIVIIAKDEAGNESRVEQALRSLPDWPIRLRTKHPSVPLGGIPIRVEVEGLPLSPAGVNLKPMAKLGSVGSLESHPSGAKSFIYKSPINTLDRNLPRGTMDEIALIVSKGGLEAKKILRINLLPAFIDKTDIDLVELKRNSDQGLTVTYAMTCRDARQQKIRGLALRMLSKVGTVSVPKEVSQGTYRFSVTLPPGVEPDEITLELKQGLAVNSNLQSAELMLWSSQTKKDPSATVLMRDAKGRVLSGLDFKVRMGTERPIDIQTNSSGFASFKLLAPKDLDVIKLSFTIPQLKNWQRQLWIPNQGYRDNDIVSADPPLKPKLYQRIETLSKLQLDFNMPLPKEGGTIKLKAAPLASEASFVLDKERWSGDGEDRLEGTITLFNELGTVANATDLNLKTSRGQLEQWTMTSEGVYRFSIRSESIDKDSRVQLEVSSAQSGLRESYNVVMTAPGDNSSSSTGDSPEAPSGEQSTTATSDSQQSEATLTESAEETTPTTTSESEAPEGALEGQTETETEAGELTELEAEEAELIEALGEIVLSSEEEAAEAELSTPRLEASQREGKAGESVTLEAQQSTSQGGNPASGTVLSIATSGKGSLSDSSLDISTGKASFSYTFAENDEDLTITVSNGGGSASLELKRISEETTEEELNLELDRPSLIASENTGAAGQIISFTVDQNQSNGELAPDGTTLSVSASGGGSLSDSSVSLSSGTATFSYTMAPGDEGVEVSVSNDGGTASVDLSYSEAETDQSSTETGLEDEVVKLSSPEISASDTEAEVGQTVSFELRQSDVFGDEAPDGTKLAITSSGSGTLSASSLSLTSGGASFEYTVAEGDDEVEFTVSNDGGSASISLAVTSIILPAEELPLSTPVLSASSSEAIAGVAVSFTVIQSLSDGSNAAEGTTVDISSSGAGQLSHSSISLNGGEGRFDYTMAAADETVTVTVKNEGGQDSLDIKLIPPEVLAPELSASSTSVTHEAEIKVTVNVKYDNGNAVSDGTEISVSHNGAGQGDKTLSTSGGKATWTYQTADVNESVTASFSSAGGTSSVDFEVSESEKPPHEISWTSKIPKTIRIGEELNLEAEILDEKGKAVKDGYNIRWETSKGSLGQSTSSTSSGLVNNTWTPTSSLGVVTIEASYESLSEDVQVEVMAGPVDGDRSLFIAVEESISGDGSSTLRLEGQLRDAYNNPIEGESITYEVRTRADYLGVLSKDRDVSDASGIVDTIYSAGFGQGTVTIEMIPNDAPSEIVTLDFQQLFAPVRMSIEPSADLDQEQNMSTTVVAGDSISLYSISRDGADNLVDNPRGNWLWTPSSDSAVSDSDFNSNSDDSMLTFNASGTGTVNIELQDPNGQLDSDSHTLTVTPGALSAFALATPSQDWSAGATATVTVTALDPFGNVKTDLNGSQTLTLSGLNDQGGNSATYSQSSSAELGASLSVLFSSGVADLNLLPVKVESASLSLSASGLSSISPLSVDVSAGPLDEYKVETVQLSGSSDVSLVVTALDQYGNSIADYSPASSLSFELSTGTQNTDNLLWFNLPPGCSTLGDGSALLSAGASGAFNGQGQLVISVSNTLAETNVFKVQEGSVSAQSPSFTWNPSNPIQMRYSVDPPDLVLQDQVWSNFSVEVLDNFANRVSSDNGRVITLTSVSGSGTLTNISASTVNGVASFTSVVATSPGILQFEASSTGLRSTVLWETEIVGGTPASLKLSLSATATAGTPVSGTIQVLNGAGTLVKDYTGTLSITSSDSDAVLPSISFSDSDDGEQSFNVTFKTSGSQSFGLTASTDSSLQTNTSVDVSPNSPSSLSWNNPPPRAIVAETWPSFEVRVVDDYGNMIETATDTISLSVSASGGSTSGTLNVAASSGSSSFSDLSHNQLGSLQLSASAAGLNPSPSWDLVIESPGFYGFSIDTPFLNLSIGEPSLVNLITAVDAVGSTVNNYSGTVVFSSSDGLASLPSNTTFSLGDQGVVAFTNGITFNSAGSHTFSVEDSSLPSSKTTSESFSITALSKASFATIPSEGPAKVTLHPTELSRKNGLWGHVDIMAFFSLKDMAEDKPVILRLLSGDQEIWSDQQVIQNNTHAWNWSPSASFEGVGKYRWQLILFDLQGKLFVQEYPFECLANIELGRHGP